jgi:hypothetical protein
MFISNIFLLFYYLNETLLIILYSIRTKILKKIFKNYYIYTKLIQGKSYGTKKSNNKSP